MVPTIQGYLRQLLKQLPADTKLYMKPYALYFKRPSGTSRGVLTEKTSYFFWLHSTSFPNRYGIGEAAPLQGLSIDYEPDLSFRFNIICQEFNQGRVEMVLDLANTLFPSLKFALETACLDWLNGGKRVIFESNFTSKQASIAINGLIWMGNEDYMKEQLIQKIEEGYSCVKLKIGAIDFDAELKILNFIRQNFDPHL
jgi:L-alanine-DL-glutamate epimerase-like enolase superfamily enzyme